MSKRGTPAKDWTKLAKRLTAMGCVIRTAVGGGNNHRQVFHNGTMVATLQMTGSSDRSYLNTIARLRRAGLNVKEHQR